MDKVQIMIVEDDMIIAADIMMQLSQLGYEVTGIFPRGEDALRQLETTKPDIVLMDINLKGKMDGIEVGQQIFNRYTLPLIYLTANADDATFNRAKTTKPFAFISKPFKRSDLERTLALVISRLDEKAATAPAPETPSGNETYLLDDRIFVKQRDRMVKIYTRDILYAEADRNYCKIFTADKEYLLSIPLGVFEERLQAKEFLRVHRSYVVNVSKIDELSDNGSYVILGKAHLPVSKSYQDELMNRLKLF
jgi:DNA-binding LytR/AlgR family response regulator